MFRKQICVSKKNNEVLTEFKDLFVIPYHTSFIVWDNLSQKF